MAYLSAPTVVSVVNVDPPSARPAAAADCAHWLGIPSNEIDVRHWLPYMAGMLDDEDTVCKTVEAP